MALLLGSTATARAWSSIISPAVTLPLPGVPVQTRAGVSQCRLRPDAQLSVVGMTAPRHAPQPRPSESQVSTPAMHGAPASEVPGRLS